MASIPEPRPDNDYLGFCRGAYNLQNGDRDAAFQKAREVSAYSRSSIEGPGAYFQKCKGPKCAFRTSFASSDAEQVWTKIFKFPERGLKLRWAFLAKSHVPQRVVRYNKQSYKCLFCVYQNVPESAVYDGVDAYLDHVSEAHRGKAMDPELQYKTRCLFDRVADDREQFDINIWPSTAGQARSDGAHDQGYSDVDIWTREAGKARQMHQLDSSYPSAVERQASSAATGSEPYQLPSEDPQGKAAVFTSLQYQKPTPGFLKHAVSPQSDHPPGTKPQAEGVGRSWKLKSSNKGHVEGSDESIDKDAERPIGGDFTRTEPRESLDMAGLNSSLPETPRSPPTRTVRLGHESDNSLSSISLRSSGAGDERDIAYEHPIDAAVDDSSVDLRHSIEHGDKYPPAVGHDHGREINLATEFARFMIPELEDITVPRSMELEMAALIRDFAIVQKMGKDPGDSDYRTACHMLRRRSQLARVIVEAQEPVEDPHWNQAEAPINASESEHHKEDSDIPLPEILEAYAFFKSNCEWLVARVRALCSAQATGKTFESVRSQICQTLRPGSGHHTFATEWQPFEFLRKHYPLGRHSGISKVICVVGTEKQAEATTCDEYVRRTWPATGPAILECVESWTSSEKIGHTVKGQNFDFAVSFDRGTARITIEATPLVILEAGEILCWLTAACCASALHSDSDEQLVQLCVPELPDPYPQSGFSRITARVFDVEIGTGRSGRCWHDLFHRPSIVAGYPIAIRNNSEPGLQLDISLMTMLALTPRADDVLTLKGLCSMFVPTARVGSSIIWHYLVHKDTSWMPFSQAKKQCAPVYDIDFADLVTSTHFVGWTRQTQILAGSALAEYDHINYGGVPVGHGFALDGVTIGVSKIMSASTKALPGKRDMAIFRATSGPYERMISIAAGLHVVFYDTEAQRAWLIDGATALLHLSRAALTHRKAPAIGRKLPGVPNDLLRLVHGADPGMTTAQDVLLDEENREILLWKDKQAPWTFEDLVQQHWSLLEEMIEHQQKLKPAETKQWELANPFSRRIEGFGFVELISGRPLLKPVHEVLNKSPKWLKVTIEAGAINILGSHFGQLLAPGPQSPLCRRGKEVPRGEIYLAAPVERLLIMAEEHKVFDAHSIQLGDDAFWNEPHTSFDSAGCRCCEGHGHEVEIVSTGCDVKVTYLESCASKTRARDEVRQRFSEEYAEAAVIVGLPPSRLNALLDGMSYRQR